MDYESSNVQMITNDTDGTVSTYLHLCFYIPRRYIDQIGQTEENADGAAFTISFHDFRDQAQQDGACVSNNEFSHFWNQHSICTHIYEESTNVNWEFTGDWTGEDLCHRKLCGDIPWYEILQDGWFDYTIKTDPNDIYLSNVNLDSKQEVHLYQFVATVQTYVLFQSIDAAVDYSNFTYAGIGYKEEEVFEYPRLVEYEIPFYIGVPTQVTPRTELREYYEPVVLFAIIERSTVDIDISPLDGNPFGYGDVLVQTQVVYPFALLPHSQYDVNGMPSGYFATINVESSEESGTTAAWHYADGERIDDPLHQCIEANDYATVNDQQVRVCNQRWRFRITPGACDISGVYRINWYLYCFDDNGPTCPFQYNTAEATGADDASGQFLLEVEADTFCPEVVDELTIQYDWTHWRDPGLNSILDSTHKEKRVRLMDWVYHRISFKAFGRQYPDQDFHEILHNEHDVIESARIVNMYMDVALPHPPFVLYPDQLEGELQWKTGEWFDGVLTFLTDTDSKDTCAGWRIHICDAPHNETGTDCFDYLKPHYAQNAMFVEKLNVDKEVYEEQFGFFLDETLFPADPDNDPIYVTIVMDVQIFYVGNLNPTRRRLQVTSERDVSTQTRFNVFNAAPITTSVRPESQLNLISPAITSDIHLVFDLERIAQRDIIDGPTAYATAQEMLLAFSKLLLIDIRLLSVVSVLSCYNQCFMLYGDPSVNIEYDRQGTESSALIIFQVRSDERRSSAPHNFFPPFLKSFFFFLDEILRHLQMTCND